MTQPISIVSGIKKFHVELFYAFFRALQWKPLPSVKHFGLTSIYKSTYKLIVPIFCFLVIAESIVIHFLFDYFLKLDVLKLILHVTFYLLEFYTLLFLIADLRLLKESQHSVEGSSLTINCGLRGTVSILLSNIESCTVGEYSPPEPYLMSKSEKETFKKKEIESLILSPLENPNVTLEFKSTLNCSFIFGIQKEIVQLRLYVDDPHLFEKIVKEAKV